MSDDRAMRLRRIKYRAWHRGLRELDLLLGRFVDARLATFDAADIGAFEALLDVPDQTLLDWLMSGGLPPPEHETAVWQRLVAFHRA